MTIETQTKVIVAEVEPEAVKEVVETQVPGLQGPQGEKGKTGTTFTPTVTKDGWVMWTNDGGAKNPSPVCIMGPKGDEGKRGERGEQGEKGETGTFNPDDLKALQEAKASAEASAATATEQAGIATEKAEALTEAVDTLTTLSNDAVRFTAQEKTDAEKYQARKNIAASSAGEVEALKKQVANLQAQAEGKTFTYETDATEAYSKDVPEGAYPYAAVKNFGGKTIVWNQLAEITPKNTAYNGITFEVNNGKIAVKGTASADFWWYIGKIKGSFAVGDKYYIRGLTEVSDSKSIQFIASDGVNYQNSGKDFGSGAMVQIQVATETMEVYLWIPASVKISTTVIPQFYNLTRMFGAGNEPTKEEFETMFPEDYYEYNAGELKSAPVNNLKIRGQNILPTDLEFTQNSSSSTSSISVTRHDDGSITLNGTASESFAMKGSLPEVEGNYQGKSLTLSSGNPLPTGVWLSWGNGAPIIAGNGSRTSTLAVGAVGNIGNCFYLYVKSGVTFNKLRIYPMLTAYREEKEYKPYSLKVRQIPQAVLNLEGYGWSAGAVSNEVNWESRTFIKRVGKIVLDGTQPLQVTSWRITDNGVGWGYSYGLTKHKLPGNAAEVPNAICDKLQALNYSGVYYDGYGVCFFADESYGLFVRTSDTTLTNTATVNAYLSRNPITVYYELAEPEIIDISDILPDDNLIEVEEGGTITFENSNGDGFRIPVPSEIVYQKKVTTNE